MSRANFPRRRAKAPPRRVQDAPCSPARIAEEIGIEALSLAKRAHCAGLSTIGYLLESVALAASTEAAARQWPAEMSEG